MADHTLPLQWRLFRGSTLRCMASKGLLATWHLNNSMQTSTSRDLKDLVIGCWASLGKPIMHWWCFFLETSLNWFQRTTFWMPSVVEHQPENKDQDHRKGGYLANGLRSNGAAAWLKIVTSNKQTGHGGQCVELALMFCHAPFSSRPTGSTRLKTNQHVLTSFDLRWCP